MKVGFGSLLLVAAVAVGAWATLWPSRLELFGASVSCGPPIVRVAVDPGGSDEFLEEECDRRSMAKLVVGVPVAVFAFVVGVVLIVTGDREAPIGPVPSPPGWYPDPYRQAAWRWWDGARWTDRHA